MFKQRFFKIYRMIQSILEKTFTKNKHLLMVWSARVMEANWRYKGNIQETYITQLTHEIDFCKKGPLKTPWEEREGRFDIQKLFIPVCERWEDSCMTPLRQDLHFFLLCLKSFCYFGNWKFWKLFFEGYGFVRKFELRNLPPSSFTVVNSVLLPT